MKLGLAGAAQKTHTIGCYVAMYCRVIAKLVVKGEDEQRQKI